MDEAYTQSESGWIGKAVENSVNAGQQDAQSVETFDALLVVCRLHFVVAQIDSPTLTNPQTPPYMRLLLTP